MRLGFSPDGSLYVGQTGRGWRSHGGSEAAMIRISTDPEKAANELRDIRRKGETYTLHFTRELGDTPADNIEIDSWIHLDRPEYGTPEADKRREKNPENRPLVG